MSVMMGKAHAGGAPLPSVAPEEEGFSAERLARIPAFFDNYVSRGKIAGISTLIARRGRIVHLSCQGSQELEGDPIAPDTIFRIYSMSKPITSLALMMLFEEARFRLEEPVAKYLPEFTDVRVWAGGNNLRPQTRPPLRPITIHDLLIHTSGLTYGFMHAHPVDRLYRHAQIGDTRLTLKETVERACAIPLLFDPGSAWNYSIATDVCGRLIEVLSGETLDTFLTTRIFEPLGMCDTAFFVPEDKIARFTSNYEKDPADKTRLRVVDKRAASPYAKPPAYLSGGGGLVSTMGDYARFCQMLLNGGALGTARLVSPKTIAFMARNHLPDGQMLSDVSVSTFAENRFDGTGFGLGFSVVCDAAAARLPVPENSYSWGGAASTYFWIDPAHEIVAILLTQFMPSDYYPLRPQFQQLTYAALSE